MIYFLIGIAILLGGYLFHARLLERAVKPDPARPTPAVACADGVDCVELPTWRVFLIQLLNIAGLGPVFGPIMGALWGPQVFLWVVFGAVLGGGVHDFLSGVMSVRRGGAGISELIGHYLGRHARHLAAVFMLLLMVLVGTVFVKAPSELLVSILPAETVGGWLGLDDPASATWKQSWLWVVMAVVYVYYLLATLLPIDKIIGRIYPFFALALLVMVAGLAGALLVGKFSLPEFTLKNLHPGGLPAWPLIFITVSCGAISGFHSTQSPLMARCIKSERYMKIVFYGAMLTEGLIALIWASVAQGYYGSTEALKAALDSVGPAGVVHTVCVETLGAVGGVLAVLGVVVLPITSGDTAFRVGRLIVAEYLGLSQKRVLTRYLITVPLFAVSLLLQFVNFQVIWRYFGWANQTLAAVALWTGAVFLARRGPYWPLAALPAAFMTVMTVTYIMVAREGFSLSQTAGTIIGLAAGALSLGGFLLARPWKKPEIDPPPLGGPSTAEKETENIAA